MVIPDIKELLVISENGCWDYIYIAKKLLELGDEIEKIIVATGLTKEEIEKLKNNK